LASPVLLKLIMIRTVPLATALCVAFTASATPQGNLGALKSIIPAQTFEPARTRTNQGYGAKVHGKIKINGESFDFVSGGRGRGSAPFGTYRVGGLSGFKAPKGTWVPGYRLSDAYDPFVNDHPPLSCNHIAIPLAGAPALRPSICGCVENRKARRGHVGKRGLEVRLRPRRCRAHSTKPLAKFRCIPRSDLSEGGDLARKNLLRNGE
jgi:hypothetical protein